MSSEIKPLAQVTHEAIVILGREIGLADTLRFIGQFGPGYGDYTKERKELFKGLSLEDLFEEMDREEEGPQ